MLSLLGRPSPKGGGTGILIFSANADGARASLAPLRTRWQSHVREWRWSKLTLFCFFRPDWRRKIKWQRETKEEKWKFLGIYSDRTKLTPNRPFTTRKPGTLDDYLSGICRFVRLSDVQKRSFARLTLHSVPETSSTMGSSHQSTSALSDQTSPLDFLLALELDHLKEMSHRPTAREIKQKPRSTPFFFFGNEIKVDCGRASASRSVIYTKSVNFYRVLGSGS